MQSVPRMRLWKVSIVVCLGGCAVGVAGGGPIDGQPSGGVDAGRDGGALIDARAVPRCAPHAVTLERVDQWTYTDASTFPALAIDPSHAVWATYATGPAVDGVRVATRTGAATWDVTHAGYRLDEILAVGRLAFESADAPIIFVGSTEVLRREGPAWTPIASPWGGRNAQWGGSAQVAGGQVQLVSAGWDGVSYARRPVGQPAEWSTSIISSNLAHTTSIVATEVGDPVILADETIGSTTAAVLHRQVGAGAWSSEALPVDTVRISAQAVAVDEVGGTHVAVSVDPHAAAFRACVLSRSAGADWTQDCFEGAVEANLVSEPDGTLHLIYVKVGTPAPLIYARRRPGGAWVELPLTTALASGTETAIAVEPGGEAHVLFGDRLREVGTWMTLASICAGDAPP